MKMKMLATALTLSMPLALGTAFAQTSSPDTGNNRSADGGAATTNQTPATGAASGATTTSGNTNAAAQSGASSAGAGTAGTSAGSAGTGAAGTSAAGASSTTPGTAPDASATTGAAAPAMDSKSTAAASTEAITGWSAKKDLMGKSVVNENDEKIGDIEDIVISSDGRTLYLLVGAGGFLGMGSKNVAVPFDEFERRDDRILLSGYTKEQLKALPEVKTER
ncbi:MAG TPA: PRC-barrel domain-containing protein [Burkholderiaceae bacterium]|nr:PRC-barrel domain-containing protein [Burkholderiaceae bacterium]